MQIVLDNVNFPEPARDRQSEVFGEIVAFQPQDWINLSAASGGGKTSLILALYGKRQTYDGEIRFDGTSIRDLSRRQWTTLRREYVGIVFQDLRLFDTLTARENILLKARLTHVLKPEAIEAMAAELGIVERLDQPCSVLSQGERQRVAIIRSLSQPLRWLFLDEPFSHLDNASAAAAAKLIMDTCRRRKAGIVLTSLAPDSHIDQTRHLSLRSAESAAATP